jgi:hypothetical protein
MANNTPTGSKFFDLTYFGFSPYAWHFTKEILKHVLKKKTEDASPSMFSSSFPLPKLTKNPWRRTL